MQTGDGDRGKNEPVRGRSRIRMILGRSLAAIFHVDIASGDVAVAATDVGQFELNRSCLTCAVLRSEVDSFEE